MVVGRLVMPFLALLLAAAGPVADYLPNPELTPGAVADNLSLGAICSTKWGIDQRHVTAKMKHEVFLSYGYLAGNKDPRCLCEVDHLLARELGGSDTVDNLWVQSYRGPWNAHMKDRLETKVHKLICTGAMTLAKARASFRSDWTKLYREVYGEE